MNYEVVLIPAEEGEYTAVGSRPPGVHLGG